MRSLPGAGAERSSAAGGLVRAHRLARQHLRMPGSGGGFSSLSVLRHLPIDEPKIDRSFIDALTAQGDTSLVKAILKLSHDFDLATAAEGIEGEEQLELLRTFGCDVGQGLLLGRPGPGIAIEDRVRRELDPSSGALVHDA